SVRNTLAALGQKLCRTPEEYKAWSQNLGHEGVLTTFFAYGEVPAERQTEIIRELGERSDSNDRKVHELVEQLVRTVKLRGTWKIANSYDGKTIENEKLAKLALRTDRRAVLG